MNIGAETGSNGIKSFTGSIRKGVQFPPAPISGLSVGDSTDKIGNITSSIIIIYVTS